MKKEREVQKEEWRRATLQDVHADQLGALWAAAEFVLQEVASLRKIT